MFPAAQAPALESFCAAVQARQQKPVQASSSLAVDANSFINSWPICQVWCTHNRSCRSLPTNLLRRLGTTSATPPTPLLSVLIVVPNSYLVPLQVKHGLKAGKYTTPQQESFVVTKKRQGNTVIRSAADSRDAAFTDVDVNLRGGCC